MNNFWIINFDEQIKFQVYKCGGCLHDNIGDEIIDGSAFVLVESGFQKSWMEVSDWCSVRKIQC
jgi:hypothetical protein